ncbi:MAG TPA: helix-turn-helix transcriptional regulator [Micromonosporaceae bacterium]|nr:helix-turn-helix transcriptional regulator [Micromonosporaceae bacterium]
MNDPAQERALVAFAAELSQWRARRGLSKKRLAAEMGFDPSYLSHVEGGRHRPTENFAERAEVVLQAEGALWRAYLTYAQVGHRRDRPGGGRTERPAFPQWLPPGSGVLVEHEMASLTYADGRYRCAVSRDLYNAGTDPITRYPVRVSVDRYPAHPEWSNRFYQEHPLRTSELDFTAAFGDPPGARIRWQVTTDRDSYKKIVLLFEDAHSRFPLYPGQRATLSYSYAVSEAQWGQWFERQIRMPTRRLGVCLRFPTDTAAAVWGIHSSLTSDAPFGTPILETVEGPCTTFRWSTEDPPLRSRFRLHWRFRSTVARTRQGPVCADALPAER